MRLFSRNLHFLPTYVLSCCSSSLRPGIPNHEKYHRLYRSSKFSQSSALRPTTTHFQRFNGIRNYMSTQTSALPQVPEDLFQRLHAQFEKAVSSGHLKFTESTLVPDSDNNVDFVYTYAPSLAQKPELKDNNKKTQETPKKDPFETPEPELTVLDDFAGDYRVLLNKFAVTADHFLLVTKQLVPQNRALTEPDLEAAYALLHAANVQTGKRHIGFYNCGYKSGASVDHKHIQFFSLPSDEIPEKPLKNFEDWKPSSFADGRKTFKPFPDLLVNGGLRNSFKDDDDPLRCPALPYNHYVAPIPSSYLEDPELLHFRLSNVLSRCLTVLSMQSNEDDRKDMSYNLVFTEEWILAVPRRQESVDGRSINSVGMIGLLLAKSREDLVYYRTKKPINLLAELTFPYTDIEPSDQDQQLLYTRY